MLMRGEWCELQQLVQIQGAVMRGGDAHPKRGRGARGLGAAEARLWHEENGEFLCQNPVFPIDACFFFFSRKVSNLVSQRKTCLVCACINQSAACISPSPRPSVSLFPTVLCHRGSARLQSNQRPC